MEAYQERVVEEKRRLDGKLKRLKAFTASEKFGEVPAEEQGRMNKQHEVMEAYSNILGERISAF